MLPGFLVSTYRKYKEDTSIFTKWLCDNGAKCGYHLTKSTQNETPTKTAPRLKGKARKQAKEAANNGPSSSTIDQSQPQLVSPKELLALANSIVNSKNPLITVPSEVLRAALRAIAARKRCTAYFASKTDGDHSTVEENEQHSYFTSLIEEAVMALQPRFVVSAGGEPKEEAIRAPSLSILEILENRFAALEVEELAESDGETPDAPPSSPSTREVIYEIESNKEKADLEEERLFAIFCLFDDLDRLRSYVSSIWAEYKKQKIDLITASVTTNITFQLAIRTQDEILAAYPQYRDYQDVLLTIMNQFTKAQGTDPREDEVEIDDDVAQWMFAPVHSILDSFCDILGPRKVPLVKRGHFGTYNPLQDRNSLDSLQKNREDLILLMELLPDFCFVAKYKLHLVATDELTRGLCKMALTKEIPVWLTFATTVFLDIHHILRMEVYGNPVVMRAVATRAKETMGHYFELSRGLVKPDTWPEHNEKVFQIFVKEIDQCVLSDAILPHKRDQLRATNQPPPPDSEQFYLYKRHPILCGVTAFAIMLEMEEFGVTLANAMGTAIYPAQFYNSLRQKSNPIGPWPLMDQVIAIHGEDRIFVGEKPTTLVDCFKQICLTLGVSVENFARSQRKRNLVVSKKGPRGLKDTSAMNEIFKEELRRGGTMSLTVHNIEKLLNEQSQSVDSKRFHRSWAKTKRLMPVEVLEALRFAIPTELKKLEVNYFRLHDQSIGLLRRLKRELDADLRKFPGALRIEDESQLPFVGIYVVQAAMGTQQAAEDMRIPDAGSRLLEKAGGIMDEFMGELERQPAEKPIPLTSWSS